MSTRWFLSRYTSLTGKQVKDVKELASEWSVEKKIVQIFEESAQSLADFLATFIQMDLSQVIVIGGNVAKSHHLFLDKVKIHLKEKGYHELIKLAVLGEEAAILGASSLLQPLEASMDLV